jgi:hypothetical protein
MALLHKISNTFAITTAAVYMYRWECNVYWWINNDKGYSLLLKGKQGWGMSCTKISEYDKSITTGGNSIDSSLFHFGGFSKLHKNCITGMGKQFGDGFNSVKGCIAGHSVGDNTDDLLPA